MGQGEPLNASLSQTVRGEELKRGMSVSMSTKHHSLHSLQTLPKTF